ncbi:MAG: hypothetical protein VB085_08945 [Peptococcaceae bacterium]|nr:hypothetical protein [Peptococcaceae bacterium]
MIIYVQDDGRIVGYNVFLTQVQAQPWLKRSHFAWWIDEAYNPPEIPEGKALELWLDETGRVEYRLVDLPPEEEGATDGDK